MSPAVETNTVPATTIDDIDLDAFECYLREHVPRLTADDVTREDALLRLRLAGSMGPRIAPTVAGLYLFGREPQFAMPNLGVTAVRFAGSDISDEVVSRCDAYGALVQLFDQTMAFVRQNARQLVNQVDPDRSALEFPETAVREALVNALVHRDLRSPGHVTVRIFEERLEIWSPGSASGLPESIETYVARGGVSLPRNPLIALLARQFGLAEQLGRGLPSMRRIVAEESHGDLVVRGTKDGVLVTIPSAMEIAARQSADLRAN